MYIYIYIQLSTCMWYRALKCEIAVLAFGLNHSESLQNLSGMSMWLSFDSDSDWHFEFARGRHRLLV